MNNYTVFCSEEQTKKALELGAPIELLPNYTEYRGFPLVKCKDGNDRHCMPPTAEEMIGWLRSKNILFRFDDEANYWSICDASDKAFDDASDDATPLRWFNWSDNKELDAINAALNYLSNQKTNNNKD